LLQIDDEQRWLKESKVPVGLFAQPNYETNVLHFDRQLSIALCSDGVFESMSANSLEDREALWAQVVATEQFDVARIAGALNVTAHAEAIDDMTIMMISHGEESS
jgi:serine phosphatase RsbU (regulator of sigma subunit)